MAPHQLPTNLQEGCDGVLLCMSRWSYDVTGGMWWTILFLAFLIVLFLATQRFGTRRAFGFSSFVSIVGSLFLATLQLMPYWLAAAFILSGVVGLAVLVMGSER